MKRSVLFLVAVWGSLGQFATEAWADPWSAALREAAVLEGQARNLSHEVRGNYRHVGGYSALVSQAAQLERHACEFNATLAGGGSRQSFVRLLDCMDELYVNLQDLVFDAAREGRYGQPCVDTRRATQLLRCIDDSIHNLEDLVDSLGDGHQRPWTTQRPVLVPQQPSFGNDPWRSDVRPDYGFRSGNSYSPSWNQGYGSPTGGFGGLGTTAPPRPGLSFGANGIRFTTPNGMSINLGR